MMLWLCLHFPQLPLEVFTRSSEQDGPLALVQDQQVVLCNKEATAQAVVAGMSTATACALAGSLRCLARDTDKEQQALQQLAQWAYRFTPASSIKPPADLLLEVGGSLKLFQHLDTIVQQIDRDLAEQGFSYRIGMAHTPKAAWLVTRYCPGIYAQSTPAWFNRPGQKLDQAALKQVLARVPLRQLDLPDKLLTRLHKPGFRVLADILPLPRPALGKRFGRDFLLYLDQLLGNAPDPQIAIEPEVNFYRLLEFMEPLHSTEALLFPIQRLLTELAQFLRARQLDCPGFDWQLLQHAGEPIALPIRLSRAHHDKAGFLALTRTRLDNIKLPGPVHGLVLQCDSLVGTMPVSEALFTQWRNREQQSMEQLLDQLHTRLKPEQVYGLACRDEHVPELAWSRMALTQKQPVDTSGTTCNRPGWLLPSPKLIGHSGDSLYWRGKLKLVLGPERIESHWWDKPVRRDYFIAAHEDGGFYWIYLDRARQRWFVHGIFA
jgi:protein ImuB